jgi:hypothetical protein
MDRLLKGLGFNTSDRLRWLDTANDRFLTQQLYHSNQVDSFLTLHFGVENRITIP